MNKLPVEIKSAVEQSGITDLAKAEQIALNYAPLMSAVQEQINIVKSLEKGNQQHVETAKRVRIDLGRIASMADKQKSADKAALLLETRFIDGLFNTVNGAARLTQNEAKEIEEYFERMETKRLADLQLSREAMVQPFLGEHQPHADYSVMTDEVFTHYLNGTKSAYEARVKAMMEAEEAARIERELNQREMNRKIESAPLRDYISADHDLRNMSDKDFMAMMDLARRDKASDEKRKAEIQAENERLKKEADERERREARERAKIAAEADAKWEAEREQREKLEAEIARQKAEREAVDRAERDRLAAEAKAKAKAEREAAKAPDRVKIEKALDSISLPDLQLKDHDMSAAYHVIKERFDAFKSWATQQIQ